MREFGSEFDNISLPNDYFEEHCNRFNNYVFTQSGREAIRLICRSIIKQLNGKTLVVFLPSYICSSMVSPFENNSCIIYFYEINEDFSINQNDLLNKIENYKPDCILISNYFGYFHDISFLNTLKIYHSEVKLIYDFTHSLLSIPSLYDIPADYYIASLRKWFGIADGGIILTNSYINFELVTTNNNSEYVRVREESLELKKIYLENNEIGIKKIFKDKNRLAEQLLNLEKIHRMSENSLRKLNSLNVLEIKRKRNVNFIHLWNEIKNILEIQLAIKLKNDFINEYSFMLPILLDNRDTLQEKLADKGLYTQVIWRIPPETRHFIKSSYLSDKILCIPIDQRYNYWDIQDIAEILINTIQNDK